MISHLSLLPAPSLFMGRDRKVPNTLTHTHTHTHTNVAKTFGKNKNGKCCRREETEHQESPFYFPLSFSFSPLSFSLTSRPISCPNWPNDPSSLPHQPSWDPSPLSRTSSPELSEQEGRRTGPSYPGSSFAVRSLAGCCNSSRAGGGGLFLPFSLLAICLSIVSEEGARGGDRPESRYCTLGTLSAQDNPQKSGSHGFCAVAGII